MIPECPFFPGKKCFGTCPNHDENLEEIIDLSVEHDVLPETVLTWIAVNPFRYLQSNIKANTNDGLFENCERRLVN